VTIDMSVAKERLVRRTVIMWAAVVALALSLSGCGSEEKVHPRPQGQPQLNAPQWDGTFGPRPVNPNCHGNASAPAPGDVICFTDDIDGPLQITIGGTPSSPITYSGTGKTKVRGIHAEADNLVIQGFLSDGADSTGIWVAGDNVTVQDNTITQVMHNDQDLDGMRFFGNDVRLLHNWVHDLEGNDPEESHVDCMQSFATSRSGTTNAVLLGNRCEGIRAQCLMAEGPHVKDGSGQGVSQNWLFEGNYCDAHAKAQSVSLQDVQNVTISRNTFAGKASKAIALGQNSTGVVVTDDNVLGPDYKRLVGFDDLSVKIGYRGPPAE
jgi:hypothetical protein